MKLSNHNLQFVYLGKLNLMLDGQKLKNEDIHYLIHED